MRTTTRLGLVAALVTLAIAGAPGEAACPGPAAVTITAYGGSCPFFLQEALLDAKYDASTCDLSLELTASPTCCNTFLAGQLLIVGAFPMDQSVPELVKGCKLLVQPALILPFAGKVEASLPPVPVATTLYVQGLNHYFTTIGFSSDYQTSNGLKLDLL